MCTEKKKKSCLKTKTKLEKRGLCFVFSSIEQAKTMTIKYLAISLNSARASRRYYARHAESCNSIFLSPPAPPHPPHVNMVKGETPEMKPEADLRSDVKQGVCRKMNQKLDVPSESRCAERARHLAGRKPGGRRTAAGRPPRPPGCLRTPGACEEKKQEITHARMHARYRHPCRALTAASCAITLICASVKDNKKMLRAGGKSGSCGWQVPPAPFQMAALQRGREGELHGHLWRTGDN